MVLARVVSFTSKNAFTNLAAEQRLFERTSGSTLLFYINSPSIIMGRTQNPYYETNMDMALRERIPVVRRRSGGGTVVHDEGNLNICFMNSKGEHDPCINSKIITGVLRDEYGIQCSINKRGDILIDDQYKVSGSAYRLSSNRAYHHLTLLIDSDLLKLKQLLKSPLKSRLQSTGTKSISSHVANLSSYCSSNIEMHALIQAIAERWKGSVDTDHRVQIQALSPSLVEKEVGGMQLERSEISSHKWVYQQTPKFSFFNHAPEGDTQQQDISVEFRVKKGVVIDDIHINVNKNIDSYSVSDVESIHSQLNTAFKGRPFDRSSLTAALGDVSNQEGNNGIIQAVREAIDDVPAHFSLDDANV